MKWIFLLVALTLLTFIEQGKADEIYPTLILRKPEGLITISTEPCGNDKTKWVADVYPEHDVLHGCWNKVKQKVVIRAGNKTFEYDASDFEKAIVR